MDEIDVDGVVCFLRRMNTSKVMGHDGISPVFLYKCCETVVQYLCIIFQISLKTRFGFIDIFQEANMRLEHVHRDVLVSAADIDS